MSSKPPDGTEVATLGDRVQREWSHPYFSPTHSGIIPPPKIMCSSTWYKAPFQCQELPKGNMLMEIQKKEKKMST